MKNKKEIVISNFSGIHRQQNFFREQNEEISWVEMEGMEGCNCYCDEEAAGIIRQKLKEFGPEGIHFMDSGNYHYMSRFWLEKIQKPFRLVVFDNHTDMQPPAFGGLLSCGGWIYASLNELPLLKEVILIGPDQEAFDQTDPALRTRVRFLSRESLSELSAEEKKKFANAVPVDIPIYISVDKDVLCPEAADTTWSQGDMTLRELMEWLEWFCANSEVTGMDVCGECDADKTEKNHLNDQANREILKFWMEDGRRL